MKRDKFAPEHLRKLAARRAVVGMNFNSTAIDPRVTLGAAMRAKCAASVERRSRRSMRVERTAAGRAR